MCARWLIAAGVLSSLHLTAAFGCRYTVRDVGFVDLGSLPYRLYLYVGDDAAADQTSTLERVSVAALMDSNVKPEIVNVDRQANHAAMEYYRFWKIASLPAAILVSPDGQSLVLPIAVRGRPFAENVWAVLEGVVSSPVRETLTQQVINAYCTVLIAWGEDADENARARKVIGEAVEDVARSMGQMPKPVDEPPRLLEIPRESLARESVLLWSLGLNEGAISEPCVAVVYGRGRRIGPVLEGDEITRERLLPLLSVIGLSCECGLDRKWLLGTRIPLRWAGTTQAEAARVLGFDIESPMVKTEISQILAAGASSAPRADGSLGYDEGILGGYSETVVEFQDESAGERISPARIQDLASPPPAPPPSRSTYQTPIYIVAAMAVLIVAAGVYILFRARSKLS